MTSRYDAASRFHGSSPIAEQTSKNAAKTYAATGMSVTGG
jgi:hypothetical protein